MVKGNPANGQNCKYFFLERRNGQRYEFILLHGLQSTTWLDGENFEGYDEKTGKEEGRHTSLNT